MTTAAADDYAYIAQRAKEIRDEQQERADKAAAEAAIEANMQRADEPVIGDPGDEDDALFNYYFGCITP